MSQNISKPRKASIEARRRPGSTGNAATGADSGSPGASVSLPGSRAAPSIAIAFPLFPDRHSERNGTEYCIRGDPEDKKIAERTLSLFWLRPPSGVVCALPQHRGSSRPPGRALGEWAVALHHPAATG